MEDWSSVLSLGRAREKSDLILAFRNTQPNACLCFPPVVTALVVSVAALNVKMIGIIADRFVIDAAGRWALWGDTRVHDI
jgi:hypothetical protein